ncbi:hypothetical protein BDW02DRAFT_569550 [Decorospora gaudefroyi]|uniref:Peptidase S9 prolyl oligopeptidase catalytic domain-containing protein n=1 Tax=Decorospora gaudefroyi TaxID=184978 RepID=A0A6A5KEM9_9PLEO|nr:hypothetical protein BDW02DRAFT_569550 [Decorospora gaudefroyi]
MLYEKGIAFRFTLVLLSLVPLCVQHAPAMSSASQSHHSVFSFSDTWHVLGPFQTGTREATWGADPLEYLGGFRHLEYDPTATFWSSLPTNATASWNTTRPVRTTSDATSANASLSIAYSNVDWNFLKVIYGWAAVQYQAWVRGELVVGGNETQHVILHTDSILEFWVDDEHYFGGDYYSFRNAPPVIHLKPGSHKLDIRLVREVRAFGGILEPTIDVVVDVRRVSRSLELVKPGILMSDVVDGKLASPIASVYLINSGEEDIEIVDIQPSKLTSDNSFVGAQALLTEGINIGEQSQHTPPRVTLVAGQTRPIAFNISLPTHHDSVMEYEVTYRTLDGTDTTSTLRVSQALHYVSISEPHKITFLHPGGIVSYAMLRPPAKNATCLPGQTRLPVLLQFHGAAVEADLPQVNRALDPVSDLCAWVLFPTGVTSWSGDDWHNWGFADVEAAIAAIPDWIGNVGWSGLGVDTDRWIVSGHSNGGQGTYYALTHRPDKVLAAAPVSGYASIQKYVPYELWQPADPRRTGVISASLNSYRHEMLMPNAQGIPVQQQHGSMDGNVPAYHSRLLAEQLSRTGVIGRNPSYNEVEGREHWWPSVMTTPELVDFYYNQTKSKEKLPRKMVQFLLVVGDPGDMGGKNGIRVKRLEDPGRYGKVFVSGHSIKTSNIQDLEFDVALWNESVVLDGEELDLAGTAAAAVPSLTACKSVDGWDIRTTDTRVQRNGRQLGSMTAILRSHGPFVIRHSGSAHTSHIALQISRNLHQYFHADAVIVSSPSYTLPADTTGNVITLVTGSSPECIQSTFSIRVGESGVTLRGHRGQKQQYGDEATGTAFLQPLDGERLELVLWGTNEEGLRQAARLVPMLPGVGQPDFVILGESAKWKGIEGALAMGFFDANWRVTPSSVVESW